MDSLKLRTENVTTDYDKEVDVLIREISNMTTFQYQIQIGDQRREVFEFLDAWVDTGASYTLVPREVMERLEHVPTHQRPFRLAGGSVVELGLCQAPLRIGEETVIVSCVFGDEKTQPMLGATALEEFGLGSFR